MVGTGRVDALLLAPSKASGAAVAAHKRMFLACYVKAAITATLIERILFGTRRETGPADKSPKEVDDSHGWLAFDELNYPA